MEPTPREQLEAGLQRMAKRLDEDVNRRIIESLRKQIKKKRSSPKARAPRYNTKH